MSRSGCRLPLLGWVAVALLVWWAEAVPQGQAPPGVSSLADSSKSARYLWVLPVNSHTFPHSDLGRLAAALPSVFLYDRGGVGQVLAFAALGSTPREVGLCLGELDVRDPVSGTADLNLVPAHWVTLLNVVPSGLRWSAFGPSSGTALVAEARAHSGLHPFSHVAYENGDWGSHAVDVGLGMRVHRRATLLAGALLRGYQGFAPRQEHEAQRIRATAMFDAGRGWSARYLALLTKVETEETPDPFALLMRLAADPVRKDERLDHAFTVQGGVGLRRTAELTATLAHTWLKRAFHDYPLRERWFDRCHRVAASAQASAGDERLSVLVGAGLRLAHLASDLMGQHTDVEGALRLGARGKPGQVLSLQVLLQSSRREGSPWQLEYSLGLGAALSRRLELRIEGSREAYLPSFEERFARGSSRGDPNLRPWTVQRLLASIAGKGATASWQLGLFGRHSLQAIRQEWELLTAGWHYLQQRTSDRCVGLLGQAEVRAASALVLKGGFSMHWARRGEFQEPDLPRWLGSLEGRYRMPLFDGDLDVALAARCQLFGPRCGLLRTPQEPGGHEERLPAAAVLGAELLARIMRNATISISFDNLLDLRYQTIAGYPMPGRVFLWGVNWSFSD